jgi:hypothetical protein
MFDQELQRMSAGQHKLFLSADGWTSGSYFVRLATTGGDAVARLILIK